MTTNVNKNSSIRELIRLQFRNRILAVVAILSVVAALSTYIEILYALEQFRNKIEAQATELEPYVMGEALVGNFAAIDAIIKNANDKTTKWNVGWEPSADVQVKKFSVEFPFSVSLVYPVKSGSNTQFGYFTFKSHFFLQPEIIRLLVGKILLVMVSCFVIGFAIYPLAKKVPKELIAKPVDQILAMVRSEAFGTNPTQGFLYRELQEIHDELKVIFTEKNRMEIERIEFEKAASVSRTAQMLAHDMKKPFNLLRMMTNGIKKIKSADAAMNFIQVSSNSVESAMSRLDGMMNQLIHIGGKTSLSLEEIDMAAIIEESVKEAVVESGKNNIDINIELDHRGVVKADKIAISRVISNLIFNAFQATSPDGKIWVTSKSFLKDVPMIQIVVGNSGSVIPKDDLEKIFQLFYTRGKKDGTGLGLYIVQSIVRAHGGSITVTSTQQHGTEFIIELPLGKAQSMEFDKIAENESLRVLVVDDEDQYLKQAEDVVKSVQPDARVIFCKTPPQALKLAAQVLPHVVICDIQLDVAESDGFDVCRTLREGGLRPYIYMHTSGFISDERQLRKQICGANDIANKPLTNEVFEKIVEYVKL